MFTYSLQPVLRTLTVLGTLQLNDVPGGILCLALTPHYHAVSLPIAALSGADRLLQSKSLNRQDFWYCDWIDLINTARLRVYQMEQACTRAPPTAAESGHRCTEDACNKQYDSISIVQVYENAMKCVECGGPVAEVRARSLSLLLPLLVCSLFGNIHVR